MSMNRGFHLSQLPSPIKMIFNIILLIALIGTGVVSLIYGSQSLASYITFQENKKTTTGTIIDIQKRDTSSQQKTKTEKAPPRYSPVIEYTGVKGNRYTFTARAISSDTSKFRKNSTVTLVYDKRNPSKAAMERYAPRLSAVVVLPLIGFLALGGGLFLATVQFIRYKNQTTAKQSSNSKSDSN